MRTFERTTKLDLVANIAAAVAGGIISAIITVPMTLKLVARNEKFQLEEKVRERVASALPIVTRLLDSFFFYKPNLIYSSSFGMKITPEYRVQILSVIEIFDSAKYVEYLLPKGLRKRWDLMLILVSEYQRSDDFDDIKRNRALCDVQNYVVYVRDSLIDFLDGLPVRPEYPRPYLRRESAESWFDPCGIKEPGDE